MRLPGTNTNRFPAALCVALFLTLSAAGAGADEIRLRNGDRLTGRVLALESGKLLLKTSYAGTLTISWTEVAELRTDEVVTVVFRKGDQITGRLEPGSSGSLRIEGVGEVPAEQLLYINPPPRLAGRLRLRGRINVGLNIAEGNTDTQKFYSDGELVARGPADRYTLRFLTNQASDEGRETANNSALSFKYDRFLTEQWYGYGSASFTQDHFRDLNLRTALGAGTGYQFWEAPKGALSLEGGPTYVHETFDHDGDNRYYALRWAIKYAKPLLAGRLTFFHDHEGLWGLSDAGNLVVYAQTGLRLPITPQINASAQWNVDWASEPAPGRDEADQAWILNLGYAW